MRRISLSLVLASAAALTACTAPYKLKEPPPGLVSVEQWSGYDRMKGGDDVGVNISSFENHAGGSLAIWSEDLVRKLGRRDYALVRQTPVKAKNGVKGTRFDFDYVSPADDEPKFYTAILFVTDEWRVVVQVAGDRPHRGAYEAKTDAIVSEIKIRGCKLIGTLCKGDQPPPLSTKSAEAASGDSASGDPASGDPAAEAASGDPAAEADAVD